jgi:hypothetical protein
MRCHSCAGWIERRMSECPNCGWPVDDRAAVEPQEAPPGPPIGDPEEWITTTVVTEAERRVTIGVFTESTECPPPKKSQSRKNQTPQSCWRFELRLLDVECAFGATCRLVEQLPKGSKVRPEDPNTVRAEREHVLALLEFASYLGRLGWRRLPGAKTSQHHAFFLKRFRVSETRTETVRKN